MSAIEDVGSRSEYELPHGLALEAEGVGVTRSVGGSISLSGVSVGIPQTTAVGQVAAL